MAPLVRHDEYPEHFRGVFRTDLLARSLYSEGAGIARAIPSAVAVPTDEEDVVTLVRWARMTGHGLIPRGSGSGMAAGAVGPHVIVDVSRFTGIGQPARVDEASRVHATGAGAGTSTRDYRAPRATQDSRSLPAAATHVVRAGVGSTRASVDAAARAHGLRFPVDPSSGGFCTVGGMVATNAAGARSLRFGATRAWVSGIRCVFDDGTAAWIRRGTTQPVAIPALSRLEHSLEKLGKTCDMPLLRHDGVRKESSGYGVFKALNGGGGLLDLLTGSEGTLAIFTEVELLLQPIAGATATVLATFDSLEAATECAVDAASADANACELLDRTFLVIASQAGTIAVPIAEAVLIIEVEGEDDSVAATRMSRIAALARSHGASEVHTALTPEDEERLWALRHAASPIMSRLPATTRSMQFIEDGCVPPARFPEYVRGVRSALDRASIPGVIFGHAGDAHAHVNPLVNVNEHGWRESIRSLFDDVCELTARVGGTLAGEHGDGRLRAAALPRVWHPQALAAFAIIKDAADPALVFNPGCKIAQDGDEPFAALRHDPALQPLDPRARTVLDAVERDRAWNRFRLDQNHD